MRVRKISSGLLLQQRTTGVCTQALLNLMPVFSLGRKPLLGSCSSIEAGLRSLRSAFRTGGMSPYLHIVKYFFFWPQVSSTSSGGWAELGCETQRVLALQW